MCLLMLLLTQTGPKRRFSGSLKRQNKNILYKEHLKLKTSKYKKGRRRKTAQDHFIKYTVHRVNIYSLCNYTKKPANIKMSSLWSFLECYVSQKLISQTFFSNGSCCAFDLLLSFILKVRRTNWHDPGGLQYYYYYLALILQCVIDGWKLKRAPMIVRVQISLSGFILPK